MENRPRYTYNEVTVSGPIKNPVLDSYIPGEEIVSRKYTQMADIQEKTAIGYLNELTNKYPPGTQITNSPFNSKALRDDYLKGDMILEIPVQNSPIPQNILDIATNKNIKIRDITGKVYN